MFFRVLPFLLVSVFVLIASVEARPQQQRKGAAQDAKFDQAVEASAEDDLKGAASSYSYEYYPDIYPSYYRYRYNYPYFGYYRYGGPYYTSDYYRGLSSFYNGLFI